MSGTLEAIPLSNGRGVSPAKLGRGEGWNLIPLKASIGRSPGSLGITVVVSHK